jgi:DNA mismatch endonuclease, patch repair protein
MASIHSKDTKPEITLRDALIAKGFKFETNYGVDKIDIAFPYKKIAVFVDGCFWHGCLLHSHKITTNEAYWQTKLNRNMERDKEKTEKLKTEGWQVIRFWEHELSNIDSVIGRIQNLHKENHERSK